MIIVDSIITYLPKISTPQIIVVERTTTTTTTTNNNNNKVAMTNVVSIRL